MNQEEYDQIPKKISPKIWASFLEGFIGDLAILQVFGRYPKQINGVTRIVDGDYDKRRALNSQMRTKSIKFLRQPQNQEVLLNDSVISRNKFWIPKIADISSEAKGKNVIIMAGAGHFVGPDGIIELLIKEGYTITREKFIAD